MTKNVSCGARYGQKYTLAWSGNSKVDYLQNEQIEWAKFCMLVQTQGS